MREFRLGKNDKAYYSSFAELAKDMGVKPVSRKTKDEEKLKGQIDKFVSKHKCKACGEPMTYVAGTSVMACTNEKCKGIKVERTLKDGTKDIVYRPSFDLLDELGTEIATNIL